MIVPCATQRMTWESKRWQFVAKEVLHAMECCGGEGRARVRICGVVRRALCWLALLYACFQSGLFVLCSSAMRVVVFVVERVRLPLSAHLRGRGRCRWILRRCEVVKEKRGFSVSCRCVAGSESALCLAVREFATLYEVLVSLVDAACGLWEGGVFVGFQSLQSVTVDSIHRRRVTNLLSIGINTLLLDNHCFYSNRRREG